MRKIFIFTLVVSALLLGACVEKRNLVVLDKFVPRNDSCAIEAGGDVYYTKGYIDLAFMDRYRLGYEIINYISSGAASKVNGDMTVDTAETNYFYAKWAEIEYEWDPRQQADGKQLQLNPNLWNGTTRVEVTNAVVVGPEGGEAAGMVDVLTEVQARDLLAHVYDIDWIASPLIVKLKVFGELTDGTEIETNTLRFNLIPQFGDSIKMGSIYYEPAGGFADICAEYDKIIEMCAFGEPLNGCIVGQDSFVNCYAGDSNWMEYVAKSRCHLDPADSDCYYVGYGAKSVVEVYYNAYKKSATDGGYYWCCPAVAPEEPEECSQDAETGE